MDLSDPLAAEDPYNADLTLQQAWWHGHTNDFMAKWTRGASPEWEIGPNVTIWGGESYLPYMPVQHPPVLIEVGTHGLLPAYGWYCEDIVGWWCSECDGDGYSFIPESIPNIGEAYRPRLGMEVVTHFNGKWGGAGDSPEGPVLHWQWRSNPNPVPSANQEGTYVGQYDNTSHPGSFKGRISRPWQSVANAVSVTPAGGDVIIFPGTYNESVTITDPMRLVAPHGGVRIVGQ